MSLYPVFQVVLFFPVRERSSCRTSRRSSSDRSIKAIGNILSDLFFFIVKMICSCFQCIIVLVKTKTEWRKKEYTSLSLTGIKIGR